MSYTERDMQSRFTKWLRNQRRKGNFTHSAVFELKCCKKPSLGLYDFQEQQLPKLRAATTDKGVYKKLTDLDPGLKPCDAMQVVNSKAYIVIEWYEKHATHEIVMIEIDDWDEWFEDADRKSIPKEEAYNIGEVYNI